MDTATVYTETVYNSSNSTNSTRNLNKNRKKVDCLNFSCAFDTMCFAYQYIEQNNLNCRIIRRNSVAGENFVLNETKTYLKGKCKCIFVNSLKIKKQE